MPIDPATSIATTNTTTSQAPTPHPNSSRPPTMPTTPFGPYLIPLTQIFYTSHTSLSLAFVNLKPLLPGHVLVIPRRVAPRYTSLTLPETTDLALTVRKVAKMISRVYQADALNIAMQDGEAAGQSVPHVHFHIIPRRAMDFDSKGGGDRIYEILEERGGEADVGEGLRVRNRQREAEGKENGKAKFATDEERKQRSDEVMNAEAEMLRREMAGEVDEDGGA